MLLDPNSSLPHYLDKISHLEIVQREDITLEEKIELYNKYNKNSKEWEIPRDKVSRQFALDLVIDALVNHREWKSFNDEVIFPEPCVRWLIKEGQNEFRKEPNLLELEAPIKLMGDIHG